MNPEIPEPGPAAPASATALPADGVDGEPVAPAVRDAPRSASLWAVAAIVLWALGISALLDRSAYGLDEATARAVLFLWSVSDQVASPIVTLGLPDARALILAPAGFFSGSLLAGKLITLLVLAAGAIGLFRWHARHGQGEPALIATGLFLLCPLVASSIDTLAIGAFLLLALLLGAWAADGYRQTRARFGGFYFLQLVCCFLAINLHPAGLALPAVLAWSWLRNAPAPLAGATPIPGQERTQMLAGIGIATLLGLLACGLWHGRVAWAGNPASALTGGILALRADSRAGEIALGLLGAGLCAAIVLTAGLQRKALRADTFGAALVGATAIGAACADPCFALLALVLLLYWGYPLLLRVRLPAASGFLAHRGVAFIVLVVLTTVFLSAHRERLAEVRAGIELSAQDHLIEALANVVQDERPADTGPAPEGSVARADKRALRVASQWPARTTIACRCIALPLPPATEDGALFLSNLRGIDLVLFDPQDPANRAVARNFAYLGGGAAETLSLQPGGVLLRLHPDHPAPQEPAVQG